MSAFFDLHVLTALQQEWADVSRNVDDLARLFSGRVPDDVIAEWHASLSGRLNFSSGFQLDPEGPPKVLVLLQEDTDRSQALGFSEEEEDDDGRTWLSMLIDQVAVIMVIGESQEQARALHTIVRHLMMRATLSLISAGYDNVHFEGGGDLALEANLEAQIPFSRTQRWRATAKEQSPSQTVTIRRPLLIAARGVRINGVEGGANPVTEG
jgi:hypothetical protein